MGLTNRQKFLRLYGLPDDTTLSLEDIAQLSGIPTQALQLVWNRAIGAWKQNISSVRLQDGSKNPDTVKYPRKTRMSKEQWSYGRLYAFVMKSPKVYYGSDNDVREAFGLE